MTEVKNKDRKTRIISWIVFLVVFIAVAIPTAVIFLPKLLNTDTIELVGRELNVRSSHRVEGYYETFIDFETENIAKFSSDVGNDVKYSKRGENLYFSNVYFQGKQYQTLNARISSNSNYQDNDVYQYYFVDFYDDNTQIASTYPDDTIFEKYDIKKTFEAIEFNVVDKEPPALMPDAHEVAPQISEVDQIALDFFNDVKSLTFLEGNICIAVKNDDTVLNGTYQQVKGGQLFLNFGQQYRADDKYIKMRITNLQPRPSAGSYYWADSDGYDPDYSNLTPPPYYQNGQTYIYWESQDSFYIIR